MQKMSPPDSVQRISFLAREKTLTLGCIIIWILRPAPERAMLQTKFLSLLQILGIKTMHRDSSLPAGKVYRQTLSF